MIPRGYVVLFGDTGDHVALCTGSNPNIEDQDAAKIAGSQTGHGIMELDKPTTGVIKSTVEDTMARGGSGYRRSVTWAPLPGV